MKLLFTISLFLGFNSFSQTAWTWTELDTMPFKISNNAVSGAEINGESYVFSFGGIDTTKIYSGISKRSFKYKVSTDTWSEISPLPAALENIAASANTVKNKIYIIGGYHVLSNGNEISSDEVIIYNPATDLYEPNGASIPTAIDDQTQCVWRDSLIYVITGWSNTSNVPKVQIYNPALDLWSQGTETPNDHDYKAFGSSGIIVGDTIYYFGGAKSSGGFNANNKLRKGIIDENDPTNIAWTLEEDGPNNGYRSACISYGNNVFWIGGSAVSYNYNGIAYNGSGGVLPLTQIMRYESYYHDWYEGTGAPFSVMDLRGIAQVSATEWIICGGMDENQKVTNRTFLLTYNPVTGSVIEKEDDLFYVYNNQIITETKIESAKLYDLSGKLIENIKDNNISSKSKGVFVLQVISNNQATVKKIVLD
jgi:hypothetical protein